MSTDQFAHQSLKKDDPTGWFEAVYANANGDGSAVPWANLEPNPDLVEWLDQHRVNGQGQKALVVGCGLGDDAEELVRRGFKVVAFDISTTAIEWCNHRFPNSKVSYQVADLFDTPPKWHTAFDFVLEYYTIQALPPALCQETIEAVAQLVAPGGTLLVICLGRDVGVKVGGPPWPLAEDQLGHFENVGLTQVSFEEYNHQSNTSVRQFRVQYKRQ